MFWFLVPFVSLIGLAAAIDRKRKKAHNLPLQSTHPDSHAANSPSFESGGDDHSGGE
ncbi:hypothetical protein ACTL32_08470 [Planococcus sp. FY231025]|uniref:hypothetical protein n=1 Tax=Planococcus sp. FY231025 TaxID=3455699 RepID=UPI003F934820